MDRKTFLNTLSRNLKSISKEEKYSILFEYETHFEDGLMDGKNEETIAAELGDPKRIAKELNSTYSIQKAENNPTNSNVMNALVTALGLSILNIFFILIPLLTYISLIISFVFMAVLFILSPIFLALDYFINGANAVSLFEGFTVTALVGGGILLSLALYYIIQFSNRLLIQYAKWNVKTLKGARR